MRASTPGCNLVHEVESHFDGLATSMSRIIVLLALVLIAVVQAKIKTEEKVLVLDDDNFEEVRRMRAFSGTERRALL